MLNLSKLLENNQIASVTINNVFNAQAAGENLYKDPNSFKKTLDCSRKIADRIVNNIHKLDPALIRENPYGIGIKGVTDASNDWSFKYITMKANTLFVIDETKLDEDLNEITPLGYFTEDVQVPAIFEGDRIWMSIVPHEIYTLQYYIEQAKGRVLAYGMGLCYFPLMAALKDDVTEVVIVEREQEPIDLFKKCIAPCFKEAAKKIKVIRSDAFDHTCTVKDGDFDTIFCDIWHDAEDGIGSYAKFLQAFGSFKKANVFYWIEETILTYAVRVLEILLIEQKEGADDSWYEQAAGDGDELINKMYKASKGRLDQKELGNPEYVKNILRSID